MSCDIIMPVWNQPQLTKECIEHIVKNTRYPYRLVIINNGSDKQTQEYLEGLTNDYRLKTVLIKNETNLGYVKAVNQGLKVSQADYLCLFNNDVLVSRNWLVEMTNVADKDRKIGIVNPSSDEVGSGSVDDLLEHKSKSLRASRGEFIEIMGAVGFCMLIKREVFLKVGFLDEIFGLGGYDDMDYSRRAWREGYKCIKAKSAYVIHRVHSSFDRLGKRRKRQIGKQTRALFWKKWGKISRVAFIVSKPLDNRSFFNQIFNHSHNLAREWNIVHLFLRKSEIPFQSQHQSVILINYSDKLFLLRCLSEILKPKKKKLRFKTVFVDSLRFAQLLRIFSFIHEGRVVLI